MDSTVRDLVWKMNLIALESEDSGLGVVLPPSPTAADRPAEIQAPALVVGDLDRPETVTRADMLDHCIPLATKVAMPVTAHLTNMVRPGEFNWLVLGFLFGVGA